MFATTDSAWVIALRGVLLFFGYLLGCFALGAALTVPLIHSGWFTVPPERLMARSAQLVMLLGFVPFLRCFGLWQRATLGYAVERAVLWRALGGGWLLGVALLSAIVGMLLMVGARRWSGTWAEAVARLPWAVLGGWLIAGLEETFFRGALFGAIRRAGGFVGAALGSAFLYATVHFLKPQALPAGMPGDVSGALWLFTSAFTAAGVWHHLDSWCALLGAGLLLAAVRERSGHLGWCIGLHAGWVCVIQTARRLTDNDELARWRWLAGDYDGVIGWLAAAVLAALLLVYWPRRPA